MFFRALIGLVTVASALAFAPSSYRVSSSRMSMAMEDLPAVTAPLGFFDPLGLSSKLDEVEISRFRECELKHGRVAMLAAVGILGNQYLLSSYLVFYLILTNFFHIHSR